PHGAHPVATDFQPLDHFTVDNALAVANPNGFDLHVRDNNGDGPYCEFIQEDIIVNPAVALELNVNPVDPNCNGGNGSLEVDILKQGGISLSPAEISQTGPFTYSLFQGGIELQSVSNLGLDSHTFYNVIDGTYEVRVTDGFGCTVSQGLLHVEDPPVLTAE